MIRVLPLDLLEPGTECVLRSVSAELEPNTATSRDLEDRAGASVADRLRSMGSLPVGAAIITPGGDLPVEFLIHVVLQSAEEPIKADLLRLALMNGLRRAQEWGMDSLAMAPLGTGAGNLGVEEAAEVMVPLIQEHMLHFEHPREVTIATGSEYEEDVFNRAVEHARRQTAASEN